MELNELKSKLAEEISKLALLKTEARLELKDNCVAAEILLKLLENKQVSGDEITFLKSQSIDFAKVLALIGLQAVPGSSLAIIALQKVVEKHGMSLFPNPERDIPTI